jgi:mono/diheme cytochrome c family protein
MKKSSIPLLAIAATCAAVSSCGPTYIAPPVTLQLVKISNSSKSLLTRGYEIHQLKCAKCHGFENPADYAIDDLKYEIVSDMARRSKLSTDDEKAVLAYLLAARSIPPEPRPGG